MGSNCGLCEKVTDSGTCTITSATTSTNHKHPNCPHLVIPNWFSSFSRNILDQKTYGVNAQAIIGQISFNFLLTGDASNQQRLNEEMLIVFKLSFMGGKFAWSESRSLKLNSRWIQTQLVPQSLKINLLCNSINISLWPLSFMSSAQFFVVVVNIFYLNG